MKIRIIDRLGEYFYRFAEITGLSRLRILFQIVIIVALMMLSLAIQGMVGLKVIRGMQNTTNQVFVKNVKKSVYLKVVRNQFYQLRLQYLTGIISSSGYTVTFNLEEMQASLQQLGMTRSEMQNFLQEAQSFQEVLDQPVTSGNYEKLNRYLIRLEVLLTMWEDRSNNASLNELRNSQADSRNAGMVTIFISIISGVLSLLFGLAIASSIVTPLRNIIAASKSLASGNLTANIGVTGSAETRDVVRSLNQAINGLRQMIRQVNGQSTVLSQASDELRQASVENGLSATQVARAMEELSKATTEQTNQVSRAVETIDRLAGLVRKVTVDTENIAEASEKLTLSAQVGKKATDRISSGMGKIVESTQEFARVITELNEASTQINEVTATIASIAEQTTLLALNAEIEAARAGEQGKGFEVIAEETAKLSERSKEAALLIENITQQMGARMDYTIKATKQAVSQVEEGQDLTNEASVTFQSIFEELASNKRQIDGVAAFARMTAKDNEEVLQAITTIAAISEESTASTQDVSAVAQEQSAATEQVSNLAANLNQIAEGLKQAVAAFTIEG